MKDGENQDNSLLEASVDRARAEAEPEPTPADCPRYEEFLMTAHSTQALGATGARGRLVELTLRDRNCPESPLPADYVHGVILNLDIEFARAVRDLLTKMIDEAWHQIASRDSDARQSG